VISIWFSLFAIEFGEWKGLNRKGLGKTYSSIRSGKTVQSLLRSSPSISRHNALQDSLRDIPQLVMFLLDQQNHTRGLGVEGVGDVEHDFLDDFLDLGVWDGGGLAELVDCAAALDGFEELGRHVCGCVCIRRREAS
jgi:hypothetical protein